MKRCNCSICKKYTPYSLEWIKISCYLASRRDRIRDLKLIEALSIWDKL